MVSFPEVRALAARIADVLDDSAQLLGEKHPVTRSLLQGLKDIAHVVEAARRTS